MIDIATFILKVVSNMHKKFNKLGRWENKGIKGETNKLVIFFT